MEFCSSPRCSVLRFSCCCCSCCCRCLCCYSCFWARARTHQRPIGINSAFHNCFPKFPNPFEMINLFSQHLRPFRPNAFKYAIRTISDEFTNKIITRLESDIELESEHFKTRLINRNPLNLESLSYEKKPTGFWLDKDSPNYYNKLVFHQSGRYLKASLQHWSGRTLIEASTKEPQLVKYFVNPTTIQAAGVIAQVIARRCLQSGFICANVQSTERDGSLSMKAKVFFDTVESSGLTLKESPEIEPSTLPL